VILIFLVFESMSSVDEGESVICLVYVICVAEYGVRQVEDLLSRWGKSCWSMWDDIVIDFEGILFVMILHSAA
jgi:hypothetical protein